jgi:hypothetical protein
MLTSILKTLNGHATEAESLDAALVQLGIDRDETRAKIDALQKQRHQALLDDASDTDLDKLERQLDRATTRLEKLNMSEAPLRERLADAQTAARKRRWNSLHQAHHDAAVEFLSLARATAAKHSAVIAIVDQAQRDGFSGLVASTFARTPNIEGSPLLAVDLLDIFERSLSPPSPRRAAKAKPAKASPALWDRNDAGFDHPQSAQLRTLMQPPAGSTLQGAVGAETSFTVSPLKSVGKIHADKLPNDDAPLGPSEVYARVIRSGYCGLDGGQSHVGRKVRVLKSHAEIAAKNGAIEILPNEPPTAAHTETGATL